MDTTWDCIVIGGGAAGLSAGLVLGRARRRTLVIDAEGQSNRVADGIGGLLGNDTRRPADFYAAGRAELEAYPSVEFRFGEVVGGEHDGEGDGLALELADGSRETTRRVLLATGMEYRYRALPGIEARWGRSVFHRPFCHGWEHRDQALGVLDTGPSGAHRALLLRGWSDNVTLFADGDAALEPEDADHLREAGIAIEERLVAGLRGPGKTLTAMVLADGGERPLDGLLLPVTLHQRSELAAQQLGAAISEPGPLAADAVTIDASFATTVTGLFAAGDASGMMPSVANAVASGNSAAGMVVQSLMTAPGGLAASATDSSAAR